MTTSTDLGAAIADARALLDTLLTTGWQEAHVQSGDVEIFIARAGGGANPMRHPAEPVVATIAAEPALPVDLTAPHVATLVSTLAVGARVEAGASIARLRVLANETDLISESSGQVSAVHARPGDLLEFGMPVVALARDAA